MAAQKGSVPVSVRRRYQEGLDQIARDPYPVHLEPTATTRARIAHGYGASVDEIAILAQHHRRAVADPDGHRVAARG